MKTNSISVKVFLDLTYGITINLEYKGFDFSVFGTGTVGNDVYYGMYRTG